MTWKRAATLLSTSVLLTTSVFIHAQATAQPETRAAIDRYVHETSELMANLVIRLRTEPDRTYVVRSQRLAWLKLN